MTSAVASDVAAPVVLLLLQVYLLFLPVFGSLTAPSSSQHHVSKQQTQRTLFYANDNTSAKNGSLSCNLKKNKRIQTKYQEAHPLAYNSTHLLHHLKAHLEVQCSLNRRLLRMFRKPVCPHCSLSNGDWTPTWTQQITQLSIVVGTVMSIKLNPAPHNPVGFRCTVWFDMNKRLKHLRVPLSSYTPYQHSWSGSCPIKMPGTKCKYLYNVQ